MYDTNMKVQVQAQVHIISALVKIKKNWILFHSSLYIIIYGYECTYTFEFINFELGMVEMLIESNGVLEACHEIALFYN